MPPRLRFGVLLLAACVAILPGCSRGPRIPGFQTGAPQDNPVYEGSAEDVYRTAFEAIVAEFDTAPRIVKPERGLLVFSEAGSDIYTSLVVTSVGANACRVAIETRGDSGIIQSRGSTAIQRRVVKALDDRMQRAEVIAPDVNEPKGTSALAEKEGALDRIKQGLGYEQVPGYLIDLEAKDLTDLANAVDRRLASQDLDSEQRSTSVRYAIQLAKLLFDKGEYAQARDVLTFAVDLEPNDVVALCNLGQVERHLRDFDASLKHLYRAQEIDPDYPEIYINLGILYDDYVIDNERALASYRKYLDLGGQDARVRDWIAAIEAESSGSSG